MLAERMVGGERFFAEHIERSSGDFARVERREQIGFDDDLAARAVHDADVRLHLGERSRVQHSLRLFRHRHVNGDKIRDAINRIQVRCELDAERLRAGFGEERIIRHDLHAEGERALGDFAADAAHAENAERLAGEFDAGE